MVGIGLTMEGINQNYVMYDLMVETGWWQQPTDLTQWFVEYTSTFPLYFEGKRVILLTTNNTTHA